MPPCLAAFSLVILNAVVTPLIVLLLDAAGGDATAARDEALAMIADYEPATREELRLAAQACGFGLQVGATLLELGQPDLPDATRQALRRTATQMQRSELAVRRLLSSLQRARRQQEDAAAPHDPSRQTQPEQTQPEQTQPEQAQSKQTQPAAPAIVARGQARQHDDPATGGRDEPAARRPDAPCPHDDADGRDLLHPAFPTAPAHAAAAEPRTEADGSVHRRMAAATAVHAAA
jgi:hypothetical protein